MAAKVGVKLGTFNKIVWDNYYGNLNLLINDKEKPEPHNKKIEFHILKFY